MFHHYIVLSICAIKTVYWRKFVLIFVGIYHKFILLLKKKLIICCRIFPILLMLTLRMHGTYSFLRLGCVFVAKGWLSLLSACALF